jgi:ubiquitin-protein ligase E3 A
LIWFTSNDLIDEDTKKEYRLIGTILTYTGQLIGLAIYNGVILDLSFPSALYKKLLRLPVTLADLAELDPVL